MILINRTLILIFFLFNSLNLLASDNETIIEIDQPRFSEKGLNKKSYEIKAEKGIKTDSDLKLFNIEGKYKTEKGKWIYLKASEGSYDELANIISLENSVNFYSEFEDSIISENAIFNIDEDMMELNNKVVHEINEGTIFSDKVIIRENFSNITYLGNVKTKIKYE